MANEVFISYSRTNYEQVRRIKKEIDNEVGIECWMDLDGIESDEQFVDVIINAINQHNTILFMMSSSSMQSKWALDELAFAERKNKRIVLINLDHSEMTDSFYFRYHSKDIIDWSNTMQHDKLIKNLKKWFPLNKSENTVNPSNETKRQDAISIEQLIKLGDDHYNNKNYAMAVTHFREAAEKGYAKAQYKLGRCYQYGHGVQVDLLEAIRLYREAAEQGNAEAQNELGLCYRKGIGVQIDYIEALKWFKKSAIQGYTYAYTNLGVCYKDGLGVTKDIDEALKWYRLAAKQGDSIAQYRVTELEGK